VGPKRFAGNEKGIMRNFNLELAAKATFRQDGCTFPDSRFLGDLNRIRGHYAISGRALVTARPSERSRSDGDASDLKGMLRSKVRRISGRLT
jgi:hypothetical protein